MENKTTTINYEGDVYTLEKCAEEEMVCVTSKSNFTAYVTFNRQGMWAYPKKDSVMLSVNNIQEAIHHACAYLRDQENRIAFFEEQTKEIGL